MRNEKLINVTTVMDITDAAKAAGDKVKAIARGGWNNPDYYIKHGDNSMTAYIFRHGIAYKKRHYTTTPQKYREYFI